MDALKKAQARIALCPAQSAAETHARSSHRALISAALCRDRVAGPALAETPKR